MSWWIPLLIACAIEAEVVETVEQELRHLHVELIADNQGRARLPIEVLKGERALLATAQVEGGRTAHFVSLVDPAGEVVLASSAWEATSRSRTNGLFPASTVSLNWPISAGDRPLTPGPWTLELGVIDDREYASGPLALDVHLSRASSFSEGHLDVAVVYTGDLGADAGLREAVRAATSQWKELVAEHGLTLSFTPVQWPDAAPTDSPAADVERTYADIAAALGPRTLVIVLVEQLFGSGDALGVAGDIPGPLVATERSAVAVSFLGTAGPDLRYDAEEIRLLAETLAHEAGHYLGLFHPVEQGWSHWDSLDDTPSCSDQGTCEDRLGANLMFPYPVCFPPPCAPQGTLSSDQAGVLHRNTAVW